MTVVLAWACVSHARTDAWSMPESSALRSAVALLVQIRRLIARRKLASAVSRSSPWCNRQEQAGHTQHFSNRCTERIEAHWLALCRGRKLREQNRQRSVPTFSASCLPHPPPRPPQPSYTWWFGYQLADVYVFSLSQASATDSSRERWGWRTQPKEMMDTSAKRAEWMPGTL